MENQQTAQGGDTGGDVFTQQQQEFINKLVGKARIEARESARQEYEQELARKREEAELAALSAKSEWKGLADKHQARILELEPLEAKMVKYRETIEGMLTEKLKALGETAQSAIKALPGDLDPLEKLQWLVANEKLFVNPVRERGTLPGRSRANEAEGPKTSGVNAQF